MKRKLFLDDCRIEPNGWEVVRSYAQFVDYIETLGVPDVISFDHDLADEHYPISPGYMDTSIPYDSYSEKTGYDCAKFLVEKQQFPRLAIVHSFNYAGARNIANLLGCYTEVQIRPFSLSFYAAQPGPVKVSNSVVVVPPSPRPSQGEKY